MNEAIFESGQKQAEILDRILAIGQTIQREIARNPRGVYQLIVEATCEVTGADCAVIYPYHPSFGEFYDLDNIATYGLRHELQLEEKVNKRKGLTARVHQRGEIICQDTEQEDPRISETPFIVREGVRAFMGMSLKVEDNILGILYVDYRTPHHFSEAEKKLIRLFGQQATMAVSNSWSSRLADIRADTVAKLKTVGQTLVAIRDPSETLDSVLDGIARSAQEVLDADMVDLYQYAQTQDEFILPPVLVGARRHPHLIPGSIYDDDVVTRAVQMGEPQYFDDAQGTEVLTEAFAGPRVDVLAQRFVIREEIVSSAAVPLIAVGETVGVMFVNYRTPQFFDPAQKDVIESFAAQAAIAIHNSRLFSESLRQRDELRIVDEISQLLMSTLDLGEIPRLLLQRVIGLFRIEGTSLWQADQTSQQVSFLFSLNAEGREEPFSETIRGMTLQFGEGIVGTVAQSGGPMIVNRVELEPLWDNRFDEATGFKTRSILAVPLVHKQETVGVIEVLNRIDETPFTVADQDFLAAIVSPAAIALENARLYQAVTLANQDLERRVEALSILNEVGERLTSGLRLEEEEILELVCEQTRRLTGTQNIHLVLYDDNTKMQKFGPAIEKGQRVTIEPRQADMERRGKIEEVIFTKQPLLHKTEQESEEWYKLPERHNFTGRVDPSWLGVPMMAGEKVLGVLAVYDWEREYAYDEQDLQTLDSMTDQAAIALDNARLYRDIERRVEALTALNEVGETLTSGLRLEEEEILELVCEQARRLTSTQNIHVVLYDDDTKMLQFGPVLERGQRVTVEPRQADMTQRGKIEEVIFTKQPLLHKTEQESEEWYKLPERHNFTGRVDPSWLGVPMMAGEKVLGVLAIYDGEREYAYDEQDLQVLDSMTDQAAIALDDARLYYQVNRDLERRIQELGVLNEVGKTLTSGLRLKEDEILKLIHEQIIKLTGTQEMYIALYDDATEMIRFGLMLEEGQQVTIDSRKADMKQRGKTEEVIFTRQSLLHKTKQESEDWYRLPGRQEYRGRVALSWMGVPMIIGEKVLGMIAVYDWEQEYAYDELDLQVLNSLADQAAIALDNANLYYEVNLALTEANQALSALNEVGRELTAGIRLREPEILALIHTQASRLMLMNNMYIALYDQMTDTVRFGLVMQRSGRLPDEYFQPGSDSGWAPRSGGAGRTEEIIRTGKPIFHKTRIEGEAWYAQAGHKEYVGQTFASWIGVPMLVGERVLGVIAAYHPDLDDVYDENDLQVLTTLASQAAIALDNAHLFEITRQVADERKERLTRLEQISTRMAEAGLDPDEVLELVAQAANDTSQSDLTSIYLYDQESASFSRGVRVLRGKRVEQVEPDDLPDPEELPARIAQTQEAVFVGNAQEQPETFTFARRHQLRAFAGLPLTIAGSRGGRTTVGVLFVNFRQSHPFSDDEQEILHHLANQAAVAIAYASAQESAQAKEQLAALGTAAATLQHRLGNTINVILPAVMRLRYRVGDDATNSNILETIERNALFATEVIRRMQTPLRQEPFVRTNINSLLREAIQKCLQDSDRFPEVQLKTNLPDLAGEELAPPTGLQPQVMITAELDEQLPATFASSGQMTEVFRVLVENAIKAIHPQAGTVTITSKLERDQLRSYVEVTVSDTGKGIDERTRSRLFKQPVPRKEFGQGAGLGLWLSHFIVRSHQGSLDLQSTELNKGSIFVVRLPILEQPPPNEAFQRGGVA